MPRSCLIFGGNGFIGRPLVARLRRTFERVTAPDRTDCDLLGNQAEIDAVIGDLQPDVVFHLAATGVRHSDADGAYVVTENLKMAERVTAAIVRTAPEAHLVFTGSMAEYGTQPQGQRIREGAVSAPETQYGKAKRAVTERLSSAGERDGLHWTVARLFGVYGPGEPDGRLFPSLLQNLPLGLPVALSDGGQTRDFIHVDDAVNVVADLGAQRDGVGTVNVGTSQGVVVRDLCLRIAEALGAGDDLLQFGARQRSPGDADYLVADTTKLKAILGRVPPQRLSIISNTGDIDSLFCHDDAAVTSDL